MDAGAVLGFWLVALLLIAVPGADWAFTVAAGLRGHAVLPAVGGLATGYAGMTAVVTAGVGTLVARSPAALTTLTVAGGLYLIWHGATTVARPGLPAGGTVPDAGTGWPLFARGIAVSALNPKGVLLFVALLPQFTNPASTWPVTGQLALLGAVFTATCAAFYLFLGTIARRALRARPTAARALTRLSGAAMVALGAALLIERAAA